MDLLKENYVKVPILLYVLGFAVHNSYLSMFGSYEFELVQARYILSGVGFVGFIALSFSYMCIRVNLSYLPDNFKPKKLLPWLLRVVSLPSIYYVYLYSPDPRLEPNMSAEDVALSLYISIGNFVVFMSLFNLIACLHDGNSLLSKLYRWTGYIFSIPVILLAFHVASLNEELKGIGFIIMCFFLGLVGLALQQADRKSGFEPDYLDSGAKKEHENSFQLLVGSMAILFIIWSAITKYSEIIYPNIPTALGGSKLESATLYIGDKKINAKIIQETNNWFLVINSSSGSIEKIKSSGINKIVYQNE